MLWVFPRSSPPQPNFKKNTIHPHTQIVHTQVRVAADAGGFKGDDLCALLVVILNALKVIFKKNNNKEK